MEQPHTDSTGEVLVSFSQKTQVGAGLLIHEHAHRVCGHSLPSLQGRYSVARLWDWVRPQEYDPDRSASHSCPPQATAEHQESVGSDCLDAVGDTA